jgi:hypothetical protein
LFAVEAAPDTATVEEAIEVLKRYVAEQEKADGSAAETKGKKRSRSFAGQRSLRALLPSGSAISGAAAIRGQLGGTTGPILGVAGVTQSPDGAGLAAANTAGGADLVLDGSSQGTADAEVTESGIDRPSTSSETFEIVNSGGGGMTLLVDGQPAATTATDLWVKKSGDTMTGTLTLSPVSGKAWVANGDVELSGRLFKGPNIFLHAPELHDTAVGGNALRAPSSGTTNTAIGFAALFSDSSGTRNVAVGNSSLHNNLDGTANTAVGDESLQDNTSGSSNSAFGLNALEMNTVGSENVAVGANALGSNVGGIQNTGVGSSALGQEQTGSDNTALGAQALAINSGGALNAAVGYQSLGNASSSSSQNTALGAQALASLTDGNDNIAVGTSAGSGLTTGSSNIYIGASGSPSDSRTIQIGRSSLNPSTFVAGIASSAVSGTPVVVGANGQLGVAPSSLRFKQDVQTMRAESAGLFRLRPVTFHYDSSVAGDTGRVHYGLIAEEVAKVFPDLVPLDSDGRPQTVLYDELAPMLVNELQKEVDRRKGLEAELAKDEELLQELRTRLEELAAGPSPTPTDGPARSGR